MDAPKISYQNRLDRLADHLAEQQETYLGYPNSSLLDNGNLSRFLNFTINNVGDPELGNNGMHTFELENEILAFFKKALQLSPEEGWGYLTNGGTEGNTYGLFLGRETYPDGIVLYSSETHYSIPKAVRLLNCRSAVIQCQTNGEVDYRHLESAVALLRHYPIIINANIGTTMKGAIDSVPKILEILIRQNVSKFYIHCDAALSGAMLPFIAKAPKIDFRLPIGSISISGHKFLGSPIPCGLVLARRKHVQAVRSSVEYIGSNDATISGSRDAFSTIVLWQVLQRNGAEGLSRLASQCLELTDYAEQQLNQIGCPAWHNEWSNTVVFPRPDDDLIRRWQLATQNENSHIIVMPGVTIEKIDRFVAEMAQHQNKVA